MSRSILFAGALLAFCTLGYTYTFSALLPIYVQTFGATASQVSWIGTLNTAILGMASLGTGLLSSRFGSLAVFIVGLVIYTVGGIASSFATTLAEIIITQGVLVGLGSSFMVIATNDSLSESLPLEMLPLARPVMYVGAGLGGIILPFLIDVLYPELGLSWTLWVLTLTLMSLASISICFLPPTKRELVLDWSHLKERKVITYLVYALVQGFVLTVPVTYMVSYMLSLGFSQFAGTFALLCAIVFSVLGNYVFGVLCRRYGSVQVSIGYQLFALVVIISFVFFDSSLIVLFLQASLLGFVQMPLASVTVNCVSTLFVPKGIDIGAIFFMQGLGSLVGGPVAGLYLPTAWGYSGLFIHTAVVSFVAFLLNMLAYHL
jgi:MFS family permease